MIKIRFINTVRVIGLFLVLTYHIFKEILPGGFFGVDVFFTFSGYLITSLIVSKIESKGKFKFLPYIKRRFCRIFPCLFLSIIFTLPFTKLISSDFTAGIDKQVASALGLVTNYFEIIKGGTYEAQLLPHLYIHTWSLALEFQYYFLWGMFCAFLLFIILKTKNIKEPHKLKIFKKLLLISSIIFAVLSYLNMQFLFEQHLEKSVLYFATSSHIFPFFIGSTLGILFGFKPSIKIIKWLKEHDKLIKICLVLSFLTALISLIVLCFNINFENDFTYKYGFLITSVLTVILILSTRILHEIIPSKQKEPILITHLADISYAMYLFHWPLFIVFSNIFTSKIITAIFTLIVSYVFSNLLFYNVEPLFYKSFYRKGEKNPRSSKKKAIVAATVFLSTICTVVNVDIFLNKKEISDLEKEQIIANVIQNIDNLDKLKIGIDNINEEALLQSEGINGFDNLKIDSHRKQTVNINSNLSVTSESLNKVTIIGDSVTLGARKKLLETIQDSYVDAKGSRSLLDGYNLLMDLQNSESLEEYIVVALGTNGCNNPDSFIEKIINDINLGHRLIFVTPFDGRWSESWESYKTTQYLREINNKYPFVTIVDWAAEISKQSQLLCPDKIHIAGMTAAIDLFTNKILEGINEASSKPAKQ